jgi:hypothetical protein
MKTCKMEGCNLPSWDEGLCRDHFMSRPKPQPEKPKKVYIRKERPCTVEGCERTDYKARGYCKMHYRRWLNHGDPNIVKRKVGGRPKGSVKYEECSICGGIHKARGYCGMHYAQMMRGKLNNADV